GFALLYLAPPRTGLLVAVLDQPLEPLEVAVHLILDDAEEIACEVLRRRVALNVHLDVDARLVLADPLERDYAVVLEFAVDRLPSNLLIRLLIGDLRGP